MNTAGAELIEAIARAFSSAAPHGWTRIRVEVPSITEVTGFTAVATMEDGASESFYIADDKTEEDALDKIESLRRTMAEQNGDRGAWFTMTLDIDAAGEFSASFDYDNKPQFDFEVSEESIRDDLQVFPRSPEFYPEWIKPS